jgi:DNA-binding MarR family transcriptional regulator
VSDGFDLVIHAPNRLQICALLASVDSAEFGTVRDSVGLSDSVLSKHVRTLQDAGYVSIRKATVASRVRTWLSLTRDGRRAFEAHVASLQRIIEQSAAPAPPAPAAIPPRPAAPHGAAAAPP